MSFVHTQAHHIIPSSIYVQQIEWDAVPYRLHATNYTDNARTTINACVCAFSLYEWLRTNVRLCADPRHTERRCGNAEAQPGVHRQTQNCFVCRSMHSQFFVVR